MNAHVVATGHLDVSAESFKGTPGGTAPAPKYQDYPDAANVCQQTLKEIFRAEDNMTLAHVRMEPGATSLLHRHSRLKEYYVILEGKGIMIMGDNRLSIETDSVIEILPGVPHKVINSPESPLIHLVICSPSFDSTDVEVLEEATA